MNSIVGFLDRWNFIIYPLLFAIFPLLSFYGANATDVSSSDFNLAPFFLLSILAAVGAWSLALLLTKNTRRSSVLTTAFLAVFFTFGRVDDLFSDKLSELVIPLGPGIGPSKLLLILSAVFLTGVWFGVSKLTPQGLDKLSSTLMLVAVVSVTATLITAVPVYLTAGKTTDGQTKLSEASSDRADKQTSPDVYYILLDGYARSDILSEDFDFDNSDFLTSLDERGFYVADAANTNYAHTQLSVPSTFNMKYVNYLADELGEGSSNKAELKNLTQYNEVGNIFKSFGYKYINIGTQWGWTKTSPIQDLEVKADNTKETKILNIELDEFALVFLQTTILKPWIETDIKGTMVTQILNAVEKVENVPLIDEPTFTFAHFLLPHPPYLFDKDGIIPGQTQLELDNHGFSDKGMYVEQTIYTNKIALSLVDTILANSDTPPIIVIASDHGPASTLSPREFQETDPTKFDIEGIKERMAILNAYYFPDKNYEKLYPNISPVNSFRLVLSQYFNQDLDLLPDESYLTDNKENLYRFSDVTRLMR